MAGSTTESLRNIELIKSPGLETKNGFFREDVGNVI
jgi:hypothetical protein